MHEPRGKKGVFLVYTAAGPRGAAHTESAHDPSFEKQNAVPEIGIVQGRSRFDVEGKGEIIKKAADVRTLVNAMGICVMLLEPTFGRSTLTRTVEVLRALTGWDDLTIEEAVAIGERGNNLARAFNVREGSDRRDDVLPKRFQEAMAEGASAGHAISQADMDRMLDDFYAAAGWNERGVPTRRKLEALGLWTVADALEKLGALAAV